MLAIELESDAYPSSLVWLKLTAPSADCGVAKSVTGLERRLTEPVTLKER